MKTKALMVATFITSLAALTATVVFGVRNWNNKWAAYEWDFSDEKEGFYDDED